MGSIELWTSYTGFIIWGLMPFKDFLNWQRLKDLCLRSQVWALCQVNLRLLLAMGQLCFKVLCCCLQFTLWYRQDSYINCSQTIQKIPILWFLRLLHESIQSRRTSRTLHQISSILALVLHCVMMTWIFVNQNYITFSFRRHDLNKFMNFWVKI